MRYILSFLVLSFITVNVMSFGDTLKVDTTKQILTPQTINHVTTGVNNVTTNIVDNLLEALNSIFEYIDWMFVLLMIGLSWFVNYMADSDHPTFKNFTFMNNSKKRKFIRSIIVGIILIIFFMIFFGYKTKDDIRDIILSLIVATFIYNLGIDYLISKIPWLNPKVEEVKKETIKTDSI